MWYMCKALGQWNQVEIAPEDNTNAETVNFVKTCQNKIKCKSCKITPIH